jgi:hypothetical protein
MAGRPAGNEFDAGCGLRQRDREWLKLTAILGFFRWVFAMRDRRRLGREMVMPAATFESREGEKGRDGGL